jgi:hypothetical protein
VRILVVCAGLSRPSMGMRGKISISCRQNSRRKLRHKACDAARWRGWFLFTSAWFERCVWQGTSGRYNLAEQSYHTRYDVVWYIGETRIEGSAPRAPGARRDASSECEARRRGCHFWQEAEYGIDTPPYEVLRCDYRVRRCTLPCPSVAEP